MSDNPVFNPQTNADYKQAINWRSQNTAQDIARLSNMAPDLLRLGQQTGGAGAINIEDVPSAYGLAQRMAGAKGDVQSSQTSSLASINRLPQYVKGYRSYLKWRYPKRYGGGSSSDGSYTGASGQPIKFDFTLPPVSPIPTLQPQALANRPTTAPKAAPKTTRWWEKKK
jgi:hypothetical protein